MNKLIKLSFYLSIFLCIGALLGIISTYLYLKPDLPKISLVNESELQLPLKIYTSDGVLIGEFGEIKRRPVAFVDIPNDIKNAFIAAEDDNFFNHQGISYTGLIRSTIRCLRPSGCQGGGGTITMQVVRGYLLSREQTIQRKIKEIFLALNLESEISKEQIFELYVNRIFLGNRSYGIEAAANTYFDKNISELTLSESATIAALAQLPSRINPIKNPRRTKYRRDWILSRMLLLDYIDISEYKIAISKDIETSKNINLYSIDAKHIAEITRQEIINRYGLKAYSEGWSVFTTIDSNLQRKAVKSSLNQLFIYDKRHGWLDSENFQDIFSDQEKILLENLDNSFLFGELGQDNLLFDEDSIENRLDNVFDIFPYYKSYKKALVIKINDKNIFLLDEDFKIQSIIWSNEYEWARERISINELGPRPKSFSDFLSFGDFIYMKDNIDFYSIDQIPSAESSLISINPRSGAIKAYVGGKNFEESNFDRVKGSFPQSGSSFKPFIYATSLANGYNLSSLINDAPIVFEDENLESEWRPQNYTGKFYGPTSLREALIRSINIVSIKLLRELGIESSKNYLERFGFDKNRLPNDLSLALGSGNFSPVEMNRAFSVIANDGFLVDPFYVERIQDRNGNTIYELKDYKLKNIQTSVNAFPWLNTIELEQSKPYFLIKPKNKNDRVIDHRVSYLIKDTLKNFMTRGVAGNKSSFLNRDDIAGKTGTTNDAVSTWFSGFHNELVTTVWVGTDDFSSLGENEYGSTIALPLWLDYMSYALKDLDVSNDEIPANLSFVKVNKLTGEIAEDINEDVYFELFLDENIN